jgi:hypothetical protein
MCFLLEFMVIFLMLIIICLIRNSIVILIIFITLKTIEYFNKDKNGTT